MRPATCSHQPTESARINLRTSPEVKALIERAVALTQAMADAFSAAAVVAALPWCAPTERLVDGKH